MYEVLTELPPGSTLALTSRTELELPLARLRTHRGVAELRAGDLAMDAPEAERLLAGAGLKLGPDEVRSLPERTQGWPAALYLAGLSASADLEANFGWAPGDGLALAEYLRDEVLSALPETLMRVARRSSVLEELSPSACDAVLARHGCARDLAELANRLQLLRPVDAGLSRYRWHPLVREALLNELRIVEPELEPTLHARASAWHLEHGDMDGAIAHACDGGDPERAGELLWPMVPRYMTTGRWPAVGRWLAQFHEQQIADCAELAASAAHCALAAGDVDTARRWGLHAAAAIERETPHVRESSLSAGIAVIDAVAATPGVPAMRAAASRAYEAEPADSLWRPICRCAVRNRGLPRGGARDRGGGPGGGNRHRRQLRALGDRAVPGPADHDRVAPPGMGARHRSRDAGGRCRARPRPDRRAGERVRPGRRGRQLRPRRALGRGQTRCAASLDLLTTQSDSIAWYGAEVRILLACARLWLADIVGARTLLAQASRLARRTRGAAVFEHWFNMCWSHMDTLAEATLAGPSALTIAELRVLRFLPSHLSFREIAARLGVSANTVKTQAHSVLSQARSGFAVRSRRSRPGQRSARPVTSVPRRPRERRAIWGRPAVLHRHRPAISPQAGPGCGRRASSWRWPHVRARCCVTPIARRRSRAAQTQSGEARPPRPRAPTTSPMRRRRVPDAATAPTWPHPQDHEQNQAPPGDDRRMDRGLDRHDRSPSGSQFGDAGGVRAAQRLPPFGAGHDRTVDHRLPRRPSDQRVARTLQELEVGAVDVDIASLLVEQRHRVPRPAKRDQNSPPAGAVRRRRARRVAGTRLRHRPRAGDQCRAGSAIPRRPSSASPRVAISTDAAARSSSASARR